VVRSQLRGDEACDAMYPLGHLPESTRYKAYDSSRVVGVELGLDWSDLVGWGAEFRIKVLGRGELFETSEYSPVYFLEPSLMGVGLKRGEPS
jgi:hypothetical protein